MYKIFTRSNWCVYIDKSSTRFTPKALGRKPVRNKPRQLSVSSGQQPNLTEDSGATIGGENNNSTNNHSQISTPVADSQSGTPTQKDSAPQVNETQNPEDSCAIEEDEDDIHHPSSKPTTTAAANARASPVAAAPPPSSTQNTPTSRSASITPSPSVAGGNSGRLSSLNRGPSTPYKRPTVTRDTEKPVAPPRSAIVSASRSSVFDKEKEQPANEDSNEGSSNGVNKKPGVSDDKSNVNSDIETTTTTTTPAPRGGGGFAAINSGASRPSTLTSIRTRSSYRRGESPDTTATEYDQSFSTFGRSIVTDTLEPIAVGNFQSSSSLSAARSSRRSTTTSTGRGHNRRDENKATTKGKKRQSKTDAVSDDDNEPTRNSAFSPEPVIEREKEEKVYPLDSKGRMIVDPEDIPKMGRGQRTSSVEHSEEKVINIEKFTMAHLCKEIPIGETNDEYTKYEKARSDRKKERETLLREKKRAKIEGRPLTSIPGYMERHQYLNDDLKLKKKEFNEKWIQLSHSGPKSNPELIRDANGTIIVDQDSLYHDRHKKVEETLPKREVEEENKYSQIMNSATFSKRERPERWDGDETSQFYKALSQWGTDFNLIAQLFPGRSRRQIKAKYKLEERRNPGKLHLAVLRKLPIDVDSYGEQIGASLQTSDDINKELKDMRIKHEELLKEEEEGRARARAEDAAAAARADDEQYGTKPKIKKNEDDGDDDDEEVVGFVSR